MLLVTKLALTERKSTKHVDHLFLPVLFFLFICAKLIATRQTKQTDFSNTLDKYT